MWKLVVVRVIKRKKNSTKRIQSCAKKKKNQKKIPKESDKRSTLESLPSLEFESIIFLHLLLPISV